MEKKNSNLEKTGIFAREESFKKKIITILKKIKQDIANMKQTGCNKN